MKKSKEVLEPVASEEDPISNGESLICTSLSDTNIRSCNSRLYQNHNSKVGKKLWNSISNLGVTSIVEDSMCVKLLDAMEKKYKKGEEGKKIVSSQFL